MLKKVIASTALFLAMTAMAAVDINKATEAELDSIKGIGPATSQVIVSERKKGDFKDWSDLLLRVKGIGEARATKLSAEGLTVGGVPYKATTATTGAKGAELKAVKSNSDARK